MAFKVLTARPGLWRSRTPTLYLICKKRTGAVVGMWGEAHRRDAVIRSMAQSFPGQYAAAEVWAREVDGGTLEVWFNRPGLSLPECYRQEFEHALRGKLEAYRGIH